MNYPGGIRKQETITKRSHINRSATFSNRGMSLEEDINVTNQFYLETNKAIIHKKPTPIQIVKVHYPKRSAAVITEGYFQSKSTTDYNGIYKGKHIDFEAKETKNKTLFPLVNIHEHQFQHMNAILNHNGICFVIIRFTELNETYFINAEILLSYWEQMLQGGKKSIPYQIFKEQGHLIPFTYQARVDYLKVIDQLYF
ncbi:Holliday junction resolvase RecU [Pseudogracilibacillus sp. SO30301A]|uniref:Holliday junction resolvase RecU n=1 Tax=Pseudogracilibacillus sp. SO30301A TaxID=3098291 RepID=UPI00300DFDDF